MLRSLVPAMRALNDAGAAGVFQTPSQDQELDGVTAEAWLRGVLAQGLDLCLRSVSENEEDARADGGQLAEDLEEVCNFISETWGAKGDVDEVMGDIGALQTILLAGSGEADVSPTDVSVASTRLLESKPGWIMTALRETLGGATLWSGAQVFVARSAQDEVADGRFKTALKFLEDERLPKDQIKFDHDGQTDSSTILRFDFISSMGVVDHFAEVVDGVNEAVSLWSKLCLAEKREALEHWATKLCDVCGVIDKSLSVHAYQCVASIELPEGVFREEASKDLRESVGSLQSESEQVLKDWLRESPFREFLNTCLSFGRSLSGSPTVGKIIAERVTPIVRNSTLRGLVRSVIEAANKCAAQHIPDGFPDALEEFLTQDAAGKKEDSYLACALALTVAMDKLKKAVGPDGGFAAGPAKHAAEVTLATVSNAPEGNAATDEADEEWAVSWVEV